EDAAKLHREARCVEVLKIRSQTEVSNAKSDLAEAKATIVKQFDKIRELERGFSFKPNPKESALRLEIGNLRDELAACKQSEIDLELPEPADLLNQLKGRRKKSGASLADMEAVLEILSYLEEQD
ncbi:MAG: hypothetical protein WBA89_10790, partial [Microcoleus sp.]